MEYQSNCFTNTKQNIEDFKYADYDEEIQEERKNNSDSDQPMTEENQMIYNSFMKKNPPLSTNQLKRAKSITTITELDPELQKYMIVNQDTGEIIDGRNNELVAQLCQDNAQISNQNNVIWKDFWRTVKKLNEDLIGAAELGNFQLIQDLLLNQSLYYPIDINIKVLDNWTALHFAATNDYSQIAEILIQQGANKEAETSFQRRPIHIAVVSRCFSVLQILVKYKVNINCQDKEFCTPLYYAAEQNQMEMVEFLLKNGAKGNIPNYQNIYPYEIAVLPEIKKLLQNYKQVPDSPGTCYQNGNCRAKVIEKLLFLTQQQISNKVKQSILQIDTIKLTPIDFTFYKLIGKGAFGEVYLVKKDNKEFAMKVLHKNMIIDKHLERYAQTEKNILSVMNHPFIVKLHYAFQNEENLFLVMDYCHGGNFDQLLKERTRLPEQLAKIYLAELILAIEALHNKLIIFRDLKPENLLIDKDGHLQLVDFGLAKQTQQYDQLNLSYLGTPFYFAPEIINKIGHTRQVDWYQFGVNMYEFLVGMPPYFDYDKEALFEKIKTSSLRLPKNMSDNAKDLIKKLLNRDYNKRIGSIRDADEIKEHPWFKDINWSDIYNKMYPVPKPLIRQFPEQPIDVLFQKDNIRKPQQLGQWTYIDPKELM